MNKHSKTAGKVKSQIKKFADKISCGLKKTRKRFIVEILYGIQAERDIKLSNVARSLNEEIKLIKTENRLSRQLNTEDLTEEINGKIIKEGAKRIKKDTVLALDLTSIEKEYGKKMENMVRVWSGTKKETVNGYWMCEIIGAEVKGEEVVPLYSETYSQEADGFLSENDQILKAIKEVSAQTESRGICAMDRGMDRAEILTKMGQNELKYVIRAKGNRKVINRRSKKVNLMKMARGIKCVEQYEIYVDREGSKEKKQIRVGKARGIGVAGEVIDIVVVKGFGKKPMILMSNVEKSGKEILEIYLTRWKCEEGFRFLKQEYNLEDIRIRRYTGIRNMTVMLHAVFYFLSVELGMRIKLNILLSRITEKAKRFFEIPVFKQYAIADGLHRILVNSGWNHGPAKGAKSDLQMELDF